MSTYTTTLWEVMKDFNNRQPMDIPTMIEKSRGKIFDFEYETPTKIDKEIFKKWFETTFLTKFAVWEIGYETFELFHLQLCGACQRILPKYNILFNNFEELKTQADSAFYNIEKGTIKTDTSTTQKGTNTTTGTNTTKGNSKNIDSTLPVNLINAGSLSGTKYADNGSYGEQTSTDTANTTTQDNSTAKGNELKTYDLKRGNFIETYAKFVETIADEKFLNIYNQLFDEFNYLFLGVL